MRIMSKGAIASSITAAGGFDPSDIASLTDWYDASDDSTITTANSAVSQWDSKEGSNYLAQGTGSLQPAHTAATDTMVFDQDYMALNSSVSNKAGFFVVSQANGSSVVATITPLVGYFAGSSNQPHVFLRTDTAAYTISVDGASSNTGDAQIDDGTLTPGDGSGANINIGGYSPFPTTSTKHIVYYQLTNAETIDAVGGLEVTSTEYYGILDIHEVFLFNAHVSSDDIASMVTYLDTKWSLGL